MKRLFTFLLLASSVVSFAQNWSPILVNEKMNYQHSDSSYISHTIWVDTIDVTGTDTTFFLNKIVTDHPNDPSKVLRNQPQFLYTAMIRLDDGYYHFADPGFYILQTHATINDTWMFDLDNNTTAEVTQLTELIIFDVPDSVKIISLSDGNEIQLSKNFGLLKFPDFENGGNFELVGIQGTEYGESVPGFWEIFDFEVGDVFQYVGVVGGGGVMYIDSYTKKYTIVSKSVESGLISYLYEGYIKGLIWDIGNPWNSYGYSDIISGELVYTVANDLYSNLFPSELTEVVDSWCWLSFDNSSNARCKYYLDTIQTKTKQIGFTYNEDFYEIGELLAIPNEYNDTLLRYTNWSFETEGVIGMTLKEKLGISTYIAYYFEDEDHYQLEGYIKDEDTVGIITPDSILFTKIKLNSYNQRIVNLYPNPTEKYLYIKISNPNSTYSYDIELRNLQGQLVKNEKDIQSSHYTLNVADLKAGMYFYIIREKEEVVQQGKVIKK